MFLLQVEHVLGSSELCRHIASLDSLCTLQLWIALEHQLASIDNIFAIVEMFHLLVDVVFLTYLGAKSVAHLISSVRAQGSSILIGSQNFVHSATFFTIQKGKGQT